MKLRALTEVNTEELKKLLSLVHQEATEFPLNPQRIACIGFQYKQMELLDVFRGLDKRAVQQILVCVLAERLK
jgi:hypothetical protein